LPIDTLKIDKSFIDTVITDENTKIITESIIYMVKKLGFETIAEGVETEEQFRYLHDIDCDNIQGFYLGKPMPSEKIAELLADITA
jgi:EAL domain-containing protein (putative c-di-GMP-specific phosphodiesterase class I)